MKKTILTFLIACISTSSLAEPVYSPESTLPWYQVELIVFETVEPSHTNEKWPVVLEEPVTEEIIELSPAAQKNSPTLRAFQLLRDDEHELTPHIKSLEHNNANKVLLHVGWRQPLLENAAGIPVHIHSGDISAPGDIPRDNAIPAREQNVLNNLPDPDAGLSTATGVESTRPGNFIDGTVSLILTRYLHLKTHIVYFNPDIDLARLVAEQDNESPVVDRFALKESRRVKRQEIHYLDHPYFGIIARVTRFEPGKKTN